MKKERTFCQITPQVCSRLRERIFVTPSLLSKVAMDQSKWLPTHFHWLMPLPFVHSERLALRIAFLADLCPDQ